MSGFKIQITHILNQLPVFFTIFMTQKKKWFEEMKHFFRLPFLLTLQRNSYQDRDAKIVLLLFLSTVREENSQRNPGSVSKSVINHFK